MAQFKFAGQPGSAAHPSFTTSKQQVRRLLELVDSASNWPNHPNEQFRDLEKIEWALYALANSVILMASVMPIEENCMIIDEIEGDLQSIHDHSIDVSRAVRSLKRTLVDPYKRDYVRIMLDNFDQLEACFQTIKDHVRNVEFGLEDIQTRSKEWIKDCNDLMYHGCDILMETTKKCKAILAIDCFRLAAHDQSSNPLRKFRPSRDGNAADFEGAISRSTPVYPAAPVVARSDLEPQPRAPVKTRSRVDAAEPTSASPTSHAGSQPRGYVRGDSELSPKSSAHSSDWPPRKKQVGEQEGKKESGISSDTAAAVEQAIRYGLALELDAKSGPEIVRIGSGGARPVSKVRDATVGESVNDENLRHDSGGESVKKHGHH